MPNPVCRLFDLVGPGAIVGPGIPNVTVNGIPISVIGDTVTTHGEPPHVQPATITGAPTVTAGGRPVNCVGITTAICSHVAITGSPNTTVL